MPKISIIIPVYNTQQYVRECLESVSAQTLEDIEAIIVDDGSTDSSPAIADEIASCDHRLSVIHQGNQGLHLARATGVKQARGEYTLFLDSDDMLEPDACEMLWTRMRSEPVDILHYGVKTLAVDKSLQQAADAFTEFGNSNVGKLEGKEIQESIFLETKGYKLDWRTWQRLFRTSFLKRAFELMSHNRLERAEDSHEGFALATLANSFDSMDEYRGYIYRYGNGVSTIANLDAGSFKKHCAQFLDCIEASREFSESHQDLVQEACFAGLKNKCLEILSNDWQSRVSFEEKHDAFLCFAETFGGANAARELYRLLRDEAFASISSSENEYDTESFGAYLQLLEEMDESEGSDAEKDRLAATKIAANNHLADISMHNDMREYESQKARIFVTMHGYFAKPQDPLFQPVQVGPGQYTEDGRFKSMFHDGDGENITEANPRYCEMTVQYWAWKNVEAEYYGFCHYRRYFNFSDAPAQENDWGEVEENCIDSRTCKRYGLNSASFEKCMGDADVLLTEIKDVSAFPDANKSVYQHYRNAEHLHIEDLDTLLEVIADLQPDYLDDAYRYLSGSKTCFCNMYVMRREAFHAYCEWLFPLLEEFERRADMSRYNQQEMRVTGHLAERLFNIYLWHNQASRNPWKTKEVQCVRFSDPTSVEPLHRAFGSNAIPVVFAADDNYSPMLGTAISSLVTNSSPKHNYDIVVLSRGISSRNQALMRKITDGKSNISLRFFNVSRLVSNYELTVNEHITEETYYRFLIQWILPECPKVLYLDSDLIVNDDVANLFETELGSNLLAAVVDVDWAGNCNLSAKHPNSRSKYAYDSLRMKDPYSYFQAGVLLLNTAGMARLHSLEEWLNLAAIPHIYNDQDVLNAECEGRVRYLDMTWNVLVDTGRFEAAIQFAPVQMCQNYLSSRSNPRIIHYAGGIKAWNAPDTDFAEVFWSYARETPFYETLLLNLTKHYFGEMWPIRKDEFLYEQGSRSLARKVVDVVLPYGSERRETVKRIAGRS